MKRRIIIGITGASGVIYGIRLLESFRESGVETHLVISKAGAITIIEETDYKVSDIQKLAGYHYKLDDVAASISSGSFKTDGMVVAPCSMKSLAEIASGMSTTLLTRAADVTLKERRKMVLMVRESPYHAIHLRNMTTLTNMGAIIAPPMPAFYTKPETIDDIIDHSLGRVLDIFEVENKLVKRWGEDH